ncbi:MAG: tetratricopeptide repeat protein [Myxococcales bacterium]|nr:tetratricopeptide repeat protein [Myxococcales bacterium]
MTAAAKFAAKGQHDRAAKEYVSVIEADPSDTRTWLLLAEALVNAGDKPGAIERYLHVAEGYAAANEAQKAIAVYRKVLGIDPNRLDIQTRIAGLYKDLGRVGDAVAAYEFVAQAYFQAGQIAEGLEGFRMVAELEPAAVGKRLRLAELYSREGMVAQAVEHFRLASERLLADRRTDDYIRVAERLIYHKEDDLPVLRSLAQIYLKQGENRRALVKLNALLRAAPADVEGLELLGETFVAIGKVDKAISVVMELAREQRKGGRKNKETAARVLRKALQWNPDNAEDIRKIAGEIEAEVALLPPDPEPKDKGELDLDVDVVEDDAASSSGDIDLDVDVEDVEVKVEEVPSRPFAPVGANVAPSSAVEAADEGVGDVDKVLLEARVYVKYKMFEHALGHLDAIFLRDASHLGALELQAQILVELDRKPEAADTFVRLAQLVSARDPQQARANLEQAQKLVPDHTKAEMVLAALDSGGSAETAPLLSGLQAELRGDPTATPGAFDPAASNSHGTVGPEASVEPSGAVPVASVVTDTSDAAPAPTPVAASEAEPEAEPVAASEAEPEMKPVAASEDRSGPAQSDDRAAEPEATSEVAAAQSAAPSEAQPADGSTPASDEGSGARKPPSDEGSLPQATLTEGSGARKLPLATLTEGSGARKLPNDEGSGARKLPLATLTEGSGARKLPNDEGSGARKLAALVNEPITEGSVARKLPSERTPLPIKTFGEKTPLPTFKPPPPETVARAAGDVEPVASEPEKPASEPAEAPAAKPGPSRAKPILKPQRKPPGTAFKPPPRPVESSPELEELDSGVIEELDEDEVAEVVEKPAPPPRKAPPSRPKPPAKRPPPSPPARGDKASEVKSETSSPVAEDSKVEAVAPVAEDRKVEAVAPVPEDSKVEAVAPVPEDSKVEAVAPVPEDSKVEAVAPVSEDSKVEAVAPVSEDSKVEAVAPVAEDSKVEAVAPVSEDSKVEAVAPVSEDSKVEAVAPVAEDSKVEAVAPVSEDSTTEAPTTVVVQTLEPIERAASGELATDEKTAAPEPTQPPSESALAEPAPPLSPDAENKAAREPDAEVTPTVPAPVDAEVTPTATTEPTEAKADAPSEPVSGTKASEPAEPPPEQPSSDASLGPTRETPTAPEPASDAKGPESAPEPTTEPTWPAIDDELDELRFFISGRFEDDAQFAYLDLQRRFPGHPALAEFADRLATGAKLESAAAPVTLEDPRPPSSASRGAAPAKVQHLEDEDEDDFLASIFDEPSAPAPGKASAPRRAVATLDDGADAQTFFDLGTAYREMGLEDDALAQFDLAAKDPRWTARARIMTASLRVQRGQHEQALADLNAAMEASNDADERSEAGYELGVLYQSLGDQARAVAALQAVTPGYRDRDELLKTLA